MSSPACLLIQAANRVGGRDAAARLPTPGDSLVMGSGVAVSFALRINSDDSGLRLITSGRITIRA